MPAQLGLFPRPGGRHGWAPPALSRLGIPAGVPVAVDTETTGLDVLGSARVVGVSLAWSEAGKYLKHYLPWGHLEGPQLKFEDVGRWLRKQLEHRDLYFANAKFDVHGLRHCGIDLEKIGARPHDVQFHAALLDERRRSYSLDNLARDLLGLEKVKLPPGKIHELPADLVADYAEVDALLTLRLAELLAPRLEAEDLRRVADLEDGLIYVTCEMERNGAPLDLDLLERWRDECQSKYTRAILTLAREVGCRINVNSTNDLYKLLRLCGVRYEGEGGWSEVDQAAVGKVHVTYDDLKRYAEIPAVALAIGARRYSGLLNKYLDKYLKAQRGGVLRYSLNQLRSDLFGTVTGRYSSSDVNIQQVFNEEKQEGVAADFPIRKLFVPERGRRWVSADASQVEFRLFAHYSEDPRLIRTYVEDPATDFHQAVAEMTSLSRTHAKTVNFGSLYGMGKEKLGRQLQKFGRELSDAEVEQIHEIYNRRFPTVRRLLYKAGDLAERRGYVRTWLGRRRRYRRGEGTHSALNAVIQGTAADVMKLKLRRLYDARRELGLTMRFTVHDEVDGDIDEAGVGRLTEVLNEAALELRVPVLWDVAVGPNWAMRG